MSGDPVLEALLGAISWAGADVFERPSSAAGSFEDGEPPAELLALLGIISVREQVRELLRSLPPAPEPAVGDDAAAGGSLLR